MRVARRASGETAEAVAARIEREIALHRPEYVKREGCRIRYRASMQASTLNALAGVSRAVVEIVATDAGYEARYQLNFSRTRAILAIGCVVGMLWIPFGVLVLDKRPVSLEAAVQLGFVVIIGLPLMGIGLFAAGKGTGAEKIEALLRRALPAEPPTDTRP